MLLHHVRGAKNYRDMRIVQGIEYSSFKTACVARGIVENDQEIQFCFQEAIVSAGASELRRLLVTFLLYNTPTFLDQFWDTFKDELISDYVYEGFAVPVAITKAMNHINQLLEEEGKTISDYEGLPEVDILEPQEVDLQDDGAYEPFVEGVEDQLTTSQRRYRNFI